MSQIILSEGAAPSTPSSGKGALYLDDTPGMRFIDDAANNRRLAPLLNYSVASQAPVAEARTYIAGSALAIPAVKLQVGALFEWQIAISKTAAGTAASTYDICVGTAGTTADSARVSFTKPAGTAAADAGLIRVIAVVRSIGATGVMQGAFSLVHNLASTGHATIPCVVVNTTSAGFDMTVDDLIVGMCITSGASDAITIHQVQAKGLNL